MDWLDLVQWPAMVVTVWAAWLVASTPASIGACIGFWIFLVSNALWVAWGHLHACSWALVVPAGLPGGDEHPRREEGRAGRPERHSETPATRNSARRTTPTTALARFRPTHKRGRDVREWRSRHASRSPHRPARQPCAERRAAREGFRGRRLRGRGARRRRAWSDLFDGIGGMLRVRCCSTGEERVYPTGSGSAWLGAFLMDLGGGHFCARRARLVARDSSYGFGVRTPTDPDRHPGTVNASAPRRRRTLRRRFHEQGPSQGPRRRGQGQGQGRRPAARWTTPTSRPKARSTRPPARLRRTTATPRKRSRTPSTRSDDGAEVEPGGETPAARQAAASASFDAAAFYLARPTPAIGAGRRAPCPTCGPRADVDRRQRRSAGAAPAAASAAGPRWTNRSRIDSGRKRLIAAYMWRSP